MSKYVLVDWEINGYDDSDFMLTYYDEEKDSLVVHMHGTTRFGHCMCKIEGHTGYHLCRGENDAPEILLKPTPEIVEKARIKLEDYTFNKLAALEEARVMQPKVEELQAGMMVRLKSDIKNQVTTEVVCPACEGSCRWVNPKNAEDKRECFRCSATGVTAGPKLKGENGKPVWERHKAGETGEVIDWKSFGTFHRNGYSKPNEDNTSVVLKGADGKTYRATLKNLRLNRETVSPAKTRERAKELSFNYEFGSIHHKCAWLTYNFAWETIVNNEKQKVVSP